MYQYPSMFGYGGFSNNSTENNMMSYNGFDANETSSKEGCSHFFNGFCTLNNYSAQRTKSVAVYQDAGCSSTSYGSLMDENLRNLMGTDLTGKLRDEDSPKRKALKIRNFGSQLPTAVIKTEQCENLLSQIAKMQSGSKFEIEWVLKDQSNSSKNSDGNSNQIKRNKRFMISEKCHEDGEKIEESGKANKGQNGNEESNECRNGIKRRNSIPAGQDDNKRLAVYKNKVQRKRNASKNLDQDGNEGESMTHQKVSDEPGKSETKWNANAHSGQADQTGVDVDGFITECNENTSIDQSDIGEPDKNRAEIEESEDVLSDESNVKKLSGSNLECNERFPGNHDCKKLIIICLDGNGGKGECSKNNLTNQGKAKEWDRKEVQQNGNATKNQSGEETNNGFPRKTKTLGLLCRKFFLQVLQCVDAKDEKINLETVALSMKVEKRRIYDVVNVMEALGAMEKSHKSFYTWKGLDNLPAILYTLKMEAIKENVYQKVLLTQNIMTRFMEVPNNNENINALPNDSGLSHTFDDDSLPIAEQPNSPRNNYGYKKNESKRQRGLNSLTYLCRYFFKILIAGLDYDSDYKVSLDVASTILIKDPEIDGCKPPDRSRCRRIYDVANVLISLGLIERRMFTFGTKKIPLFAYCGPAIIEGGKIDFFHHIRFNKLSAKLKNSEEKKAYEIEEENLENFFLEKNGIKKRSESVNDVDEPKEKRDKIEITNQNQENVELNKENVSPILINPIASSQVSVSVPVVRPQPHIAADLSSVFAYQQFPTFNDLQPVVQQPRFHHFMPLPMYPQGFFPSDPRMIFLNNENVLHNVNYSRIPMQQQNFDYISAAYPFSSIAFLQRPQNGTIDVETTSYADTYSNTTNNFIYPLRHPVFNIDSILNNSRTRANSQVYDHTSTFTIQHSTPTSQNSHPH